MSCQRKTTIRICRRAAYFLFNNSVQPTKVLNEREFIARCYQIS